MQQRIDADDDPGRERRGDPEIRQQKDFVVDPTRRSSVMPVTCPSPGAMKTSIATTSANAHVLMEKYASRRRNRKMIRPQHDEGEEDEIGVQKPGIGIEAEPDQLRDAKRDAGEHGAPERS